MTIIDEMRREAGNAERSGHTYEALFMTEWADRLAASGALVPVPDGPRREAFMCGKVLHDGRYCFVRPRILDDYFPLQINDSITGRYVDKVTGQTLLQPVRLVAIAEAEI